MVNQKRVWTSEGPITTDEPIVPEEIELVPDFQLYDWLEQLEFADLDNIPGSVKNIPYTSSEIFSEITRREYVESSSVFSWDALPQYALAER